VSGLDGLDLPGRAAKHDITCAEYVRIASAYPGIFAPPTTDASVARVSRWIGAGKPAPDLSRLMFTGADSVRVIVVELLASIPAPAGWHGVEFVHWFEVGRDARGWQKRANPTRTPPADAAHVIALCGALPDDELRGIVGHELGHSFHAVVFPAMSHVPMTQHEQSARQLVGGKMRGADLDQVARELAREEALADAQSSAWGIARPSDHRHLVQHFRAQLAVAAELAADIEHRIDEDMSTGRVAASPTIGGKP
jgi:hypothetical protein